MTTHQITRQFSEYLCSLCTETQTDDAVSAATFETVCAVHSTMLV